MSDLQANPFEHAGHWYWRDETGNCSRAFKTQRDALRDLLNYLDWLANGPPWHARLWNQLKEFCNDTRG